MDEILQCPSCRALLPAAAWFCPNCGRPRTWLEEALVRQAELSGVPFTRLLAQARQQIARPDGHLAQLRDELRVVEERLARVEAFAGIAAPTPAPAAMAPVLPAPPPVATPAPTPAPADVAVPRPEVVPPEPALTLPVETALRELREVVRGVEPPPARPAVQPARDLEQLLGGRVLAWVGGLALLVGAVFFLSLAFSRGWIGQEARVTIGLVAGAALVLGGGWFFERREALFGHVLLATGLGILDLSFLAGTRLYDWLPVWAGLLGTLASALVAAVIATRASSQVVALYGLLAALLAPPLFGASPDTMTVGYLAAILVGTTGISLYRTWRWLPPVAFLFSAPQLADWVVSDASLAPVLTAVAAYWLLNAVAAAGEEFRVDRRRLSNTSATLMLANAAFLVWAGFYRLDGDLDGWRGSFLLVVAAAHGLLGGYFLLDRGDRHPFGLLTAGTGVAALTMAIPVQLGGPVVPVAWAAEAAALAWVFARLRNPYSVATASLLGLAAIGHLLAFEYPPDDVGSFDSRYVFLNASAGTLAFLLAALAFGGWVLHDRFARAVAAIFGLLLVAWAMPFELSDIPLLTGWAALTVLAVGATRLTLFTRDDVPAPAGWDPFAGVALCFPAAITALLAGCHFVTVDLPIAPEQRITRPAIPFTDHYTLAALIAIAATVAVGRLSRYDVVTRWSVPVATAVAAYLLRWELPVAALVVGWAALAAGHVLAARRWPRFAGVCLLSLVALLGLGLLVTMLRVAPPERLAVDARVALDHPPLWSGATAALGALALALVLAWWSRRQARGGWQVAGLAAALAVYLLSVGLVDEFQGRVGSGRALEELQKQAQAGLSILWAVLGGAAFVTGIVWRRKLERLLGLALLGLATAKVFVVDLASLDAAYRVLSFIGLGILLLASSYAYQHLMPRLAGDDDQPEGPTGPGRPRWTGMSHGS